MRLGGQEDRPPGQMDGGAHRRRSSPTRTAAITSPTPNSRSTPTARSSASGSHTIANLGAYPVDLLVVGADLSLRAAAVGAVRHPRDLLPRSTRSTPTPRRSTPVAARAARRRPSSSSASWRRPRARPGAIRPSSAGRTSSPRSRIRRRSFLAYDVGDYAEGARQGARARRLQGRRRAQGGLGRQGQAARRRLLRLHRGLRPRALAGRRLARRRRRPLGVGRSARQPDRHRRGADRLAQPRPGPRDDLRPARLRPSRHPDRERLDRPWRHRQGAVRHGHLRLALRRGRHVGDLQGARQDRGQGEEGGRRTCSRPPTTTSSSRTASSRSRAPTSRSTSVSVALNAYIAAQVQRPGSSSPA